MIRLSSEGLNNLTNLLELVPAFDRHIRTYRQETDTDSKLAGYLADAVEALSYFWDRTYAVTFTNPYTYVVDPDIEARDKRPLILMGSIIYKMGNINIAAFSDGDFSYNPFPRGKDTSSIALDVNELEKYGFMGPRLAQARTAPMRGFNNIFNRESYDWTAVFALFG